MTFGGHAVARLVARDAIAEPLDLTDELVPDDQPRQVVVMRRSEGDWEVRFPQDPADRLPLSDLPLAGDRRVLDLVAEAPGRERWAVALPPMDWAVDDHDALKRGIERGEIPVQTIDVEVE